MAYLSVTNLEHFTEKIYSGDNENTLSLIFNGIELEDADLHCEKLTVKPRIIPNGSQSLYLDNFVSKEAELILHNVDESILVGPVEISITTVVDNIDEVIPIGLFNISETPVSDQGKVTLTLRDFATNFDFNYNAQPLMEANDGTATKLQIFNDICTQAGVETTVQNFLGASDEVGTYDSSITARQYIGYLAEQAGAIATINRTGQLIFVYLDNLYTWNIPFDLVEKYEAGKEYQISKVQYDDAIRIFEAGDNTADTLYINSENPYISNQEQIDAIYDIVNDFYTGSVKTGKIIGNPLIDAYDLVSFTDDTLDKTFTFLATHTLTYNGGYISEFDNTISEVERETNITQTPEAYFKKIAKTNIDNINNNITMIVEEQNEQSDRITQVTQDINSIQNLFQITGGNNMIKDSQLLLKDEGNWVYGEIGNYSFFPSSSKYPSSSRNPIEYYYKEPTYVGGYDSTLIGKTVSIAKIGISNGKMTTSETNISNLVIGSMYTLSYKISNDINTNTKIKLIGNGNLIYEDTINERINFQEKSFSFVAQTSNYKIEIQTTSTTDGFAYIYDLMLNKGDIQTWTPAAGEIVSTIVKLSQLGVQVFSSSEEIATLMTSQGFEVVRYSNGTLYEVITKFTKDGFESKKGSLQQLEIGNYDFKTVNYQGYETLVLYKKESDN